MTTTRTDFYTGKFQFTFDMAPPSTVAIWGPSAVEQACQERFAREFNVHPRQVTTRVNIDDETGKVESITCRIDMRLQDDNVQLAHMYFVDGITNLPIVHASFGQWRRMTDGDGWVMDEITRTGH